MTNIMLTARNFRYRSNLTNMTEKPSRALEERKIYWYSTHPYTIQRPRSHHRRPIPNSEELYTIITEHEGYVRERTRPKYPEKGSYIQEL